MKIRWCVVDPITDIWIYQEDEIDVLPPEDTPITLGFWKGKEMTAAVTSCDDDGGPYSYNKIGRVWDINLTILVEHDIQTEHERWHEFFKNESWHPLLVP